MAGSRFAYVRDFELPDPVLPGVYMVVRIDGKGFHKFSEAHNFVKPNDVNALELMNRSALYVCEQLRGEVTLAFGESDEYSFLLKKSCRLYNRRSSKILTYIVSLFTSSYVFNWSKFLPNTDLKYPPTFDGRIILYPTTDNIRDYFSWRQADTHINNLYNTIFWALVQDGHKSEREAHAILKGSVSSEKNEMLFSKFGINYSKLPAVFRKGTTIAWVQDEDELIDVGKATAEKLADHDVPHSSSPRKREQKSKVSGRFQILHVDIIGKEFWSDPDTLSDRAQKKLQSQGNKVDDQARTQNSSTPEWERSDRLSGVGMGRWAL
ncbi:unnamed protein product [Sympodiomycopsis kandeliae]